MKNNYFELTCNQLGDNPVAITCEECGDGWYNLTARAELREKAAVGDWKIQVSPTFQPDFYYTPHLTPEDDNVIDMHVFRTPVMMMGKKDLVVCVLPVMDHVQQGKNRVYMDLDARENRMTMGISTTEITSHVLFRKTGRAVLPAGEFLFRGRILVQQGTQAENPFRAILSYFWETYGREQSQCLPEFKKLMPYVAHTYAWALDQWKDTAWQEFILDGKKVGGVQMIVITKQSPNYHKEYSIRERNAIWNQAWFSSLRSAQGLYRYGKEIGREDYVEKARMTKELALCFPQDDGLFDSIIATPNQEYEHDGEIFIRAGDWSEYCFGNSNRNPVTVDLEKAPRHILDMSWTGLQMLSWYRDLEKDQRLVEYVTAYANRLMKLQDEDGFFPAWIEKTSGKVLPYLCRSAECGVSVALLLDLYEITGEEELRAAALRCMDALVRDVMPESRWEDFETYWSCSRLGSTDMVGKKYSRNGVYKQCSLSPFYMALGLLRCYEITKNSSYLKLGRHCLDEMLMFQSSFQPDYFPIAVVGGFGVMNADAELNDARQSLFAELIIRYGELLHCDEYISRGFAAMRASFSMMYCPENPQVKEQWEKRWPFFNEKDYGFMMENYGHDGTAEDENLGIGEFTIYDWGNGAASEAVMRIRAHGHRDC